MGSARVPRASSGVAPELLPHTLPGISRREKFAGRCFRRDAENHTPEACAPRNTPLRPFSISEFGLKAGAFILWLPRWKEDQKSRFLYLQHAIEPSIEPELRSRARENGGRDSALSLSQN